MQANDGWVVGRVVVKAMQSNAMQKQRRWRATGPSHTTKIRGSCTHGTRGLVYEPSIGWSLPSPVGIARFSRGREEQFGLPAQRLVQAGQKACFATLRALTRRTMMSRRPAKDPKLLASLGSHAPICNLESRGQPTPARLRYGFDGMGTLAFPPRARTHDLRRPIWLLRHSFGQFMTLVPPCTSEQKNTEKTISGGR